MYVPATVRCDVCGDPRTKIKGWFSVYIGKEVINVRSYEDENQHIPAVCGEECLHTYVSQNLGRIKHERKLSQIEA